jgi:glycerol-3-phosphate acyltransferase PlsX
MTTKIRLALDAMGGDHAPKVVVQGADIALERVPDLSFVLVGDRDRVMPLIEQTKRLKTSDFDFIHTDEVVAGDTKPSQALRSGRRSSMRLAIDAVAKGEVDGVVSAGNTGALMAMSMFSLGKCPGIARPAIASFFPTVRGETCMLDLGANIECDAENLVQFALLGEIFARTVLGIKRPSVGLLNVGSEEQKGHAHIREAAAILRKTSAHLDFHGFVEGDDITAGTVDVIVTDGFTGNIALKTAEGTARMVGSFLKEAFTSSLLSGVGYLFARGAITQLRRRLDPRRYNGAVLLGLNGISVKSHGGTDALGFANAIGVGADMARHGFLDGVKKELEAIGITDQSAPSSPEDASRAAVS